MSWIKAITGAAKKVGNDAKVGARFLSQKANKVASPINELAKESVEKSPYLTAALAGGVGLGAGALMSDEPYYLESPEITQLIVQLRKQGLSDDQIQEYIDNIMQAQEE